MLTLGFMLDHFVFANRNLKVRTRAAAFTACAAIIIGVWWWYRRIAWGMEGSVNDVGRVLSLCLHDADTVANSNMA